MAQEIPVVERKNRENETVLDYCDKYDKPKIKAIIEKASTATKDNLSDLESSFATAQKTLNDLGSS